MDYGLLWPFRIAGTGHYRDYGSHWLMLWHSNIGHPFYVAIPTINTIHYTIDRSNFSDADCKWYLHLISSCPLSNCQRLPFSLPGLAHTALSSWTTVPSIMMKMSDKLLKWNVVCSSMLLILWYQDNHWAGARLIYLLPYSPDYNPIEQTFHSIKAWLRCHESEAINAAVRPWLIHQATMSISVEDAEGWIGNCGYSWD